jgi:hypothetical protein
VLDGVVLIEPVRLLQQEQDPLERFELLLGHVEQEAAAEAIQLGLAWIDLSESRKKLRDGGLGVREGNYLQRSSRSSCGGSCPLDDDRFSPPPPAIAIHRPPRPLSTLLSSLSLSLSLSLQALAAQPGRIEYS